MGSWGGFGKVVGKIFVIVEHPNLNGKYVLTPIDNQDCKEGTYFAPIEGLSYKKVEKIYTKEGLKEVTKIYDKIKKLKIAVVSHSNSKVTSTPWTYMENIVENFKEGDYPSKKEFINMNRLWNEVSENK